MENIQTMETEFQELLAQSAKRCGALSTDGQWSHDAIEKMVAHFCSDAAAEDFKTWQQRVVASPCSSDSAADALSKINKYKGSGDAELKSLAYFFAKQSYQIRPQIFAEDFAWLCVGCLKATGREKSPSASAFRRTVAQDLSSIRLPPQCRNSSKIAKIAGHYAVVILGDDTNLAKVYERARKNYLESPGDENRIVEFGWTLYDCLKQSIHLKNLKLTRFFSKDFAALKLPSDCVADANDGNKSAVSLLASSREKILRSAEEVVSGLGQVKSLVQDRQWHGALVACDCYLEDNPRSPEGNLLRPKILGELHDFSGALNGYWNYFQLFGQNAEAVKEYAWFIVRTFASFRPKDPEWRKLKIGIAGVSAFFDQVLSKFELFEGLEKPSKVYSALVNSVTRVCGAMLSGRRSRLAGQYIEFIEKWGLRNLSASDEREWVDSSHRSHPSLRMRVVDMLVRAALCLVKGDSLDAHPVIREFVTRSLDHSGVATPTGLRWRLPRFYQLLGDSTSARRSAVELVATFPTCASSWNILGNTYPDDSEERMICRCKSRKMESAEERSNREWLRGIGISLLRTRSGVLGSRDDPLETAILRRGIKEENLEAYISDRSEQAERLLLQNGDEVDGLVLTGFLDKHDGKMRYRLWWPTDHEIPEGHAFAVLNDFEANADRPVVGSPVSIQLVRIDGKLKPVRISSRVAPLWDGYPQVDSVVVSTDKSRGFVRLVTRSGTDLWADLHQCPELAGLVPGDGCRIGVLKRQNDVRVLFGRGCVDSVKACSEYVKTYSGELGHHNGSPGGFVGDVSVPRNLSRGIPLGTAVKGIAVKVTVNRRTKQPAWLAVTVEKPKQAKTT